jgi:hypothetical protein
MPGTWRRLAVCHRRHAASFGIPNIVVVVVTVMAAETFAAIAGYLPLSTFGCRSDVMDRGLQHCVVLQIN